MVNPNTRPDTALTRREFIKVSGTILLVAGLGGPPASDGASTDPHTGWILAPAEGIPPSDGYLLVDIEKCQGCVSCMLACSLIHEGVESLSLSRIQITQNSFEAFPNDISIDQCRQCVEPACVEICPTGALAPNAEFGNVRMVDQVLCIGCGLCATACPYTPNRAFLAPEPAYDNALKSRKCDLCSDTPYHWDEAGGGPHGQQACVAVCPVGAILFTTDIPVQTGDDGYIVNLRGASWGSLGYPNS